MHKKFLQKVVVVGSGTSTGVPLLGCECAVCRSANLKNKRLRSSLYLELSSGHKVIVDTGPDFRAQALSVGLRKLDAVLYTHTHADHCHGFDDLRAFSIYQKEPIKVYGYLVDLKDLRERFSYAFSRNGYGGLLPTVELIEIPANGFNLFGTWVDVARLPHGDGLSTAFRIGDFAYATDFKSFSKEQIAEWRGKIRVMVASGIYYGEHRTHSVIPETLELFDRLEVEEGWITHLAHTVDHDEVSTRLPRGRKLSFDGVEVYSLSKAAKID